MPFRPLSETLFNSFGNVVFSRCDFLRDVSPIYIFFIFKIFVDERKLKAFHSVADDDHIVAAQIEQHKYHEKERNKNARK